MKNRMINTSVWLDDWFISLSKNGKLLFLYLITSPFNNESGIYEIPLVYISTMTGIDAKEVKIELENMFPKVGYKSNFIILTNYIKHQKVNNSWLVAVKRRVAEVEKKLQGYEPYEIYKENLKKGKGNDISGIKTESIRLPE